MGERDKKILIVDDSETFLMYTSILLNRMGFDTIISAKDGIEALKLLRILMPDIVLLDIIMPQMDGITVLRHIKGNEQTLSIPVIIVTIKSDRHSVEECERLGCSNYLTKPLNLIELHNALNENISYPRGKKRKLLRTSFKKKVVLTHKGEKEELLAENLSEGGIYIRKRNPFRVGTDVELTIPLNEEKSVNLMGTVISIRGFSGEVFYIPPGMAIEFKDLPNSDALMIKEHITELLTEDILEEQNEPIITIDSQKNKHVK
jgi:CheY-like chemotaxis protein/Tfp pilus assembly protein PilZ